VKNRKLNPPPAVEQPMMDFAGSRLVTAWFRRRFARQDEVNQAILALIEVSCGCQAPPGARAVGFLYGRYVTGVWVAG
jgi:hypothetical protein